MEPFVVSRATFQFTKLVDSKGNFHESMSTKYALKMAEDENLDLVCFKQPEGETPALCKIVNYGKKLNMVQQKVGWMKVIL